MGASRRHPHAVTSCTHAHPPQASTSDNADLNASAGRSRGFGFADPGCYGAAYIWGVQSSWSRLSGPCGQGEQAVIIEPCPGRSLGQFRPIHVAPHDGQVLVAGMLQKGRERLVPRIRGKPSPHPDRRNAGISTFRTSTLQDRRLLGAPTGSTAALSRRSGTSRSRKPAMKPITSTPFQPTSDQDTRGASPSASF